MARVVMEPGWQEHARVSADELLSGKLGPAIAGDAKRYAPKRTGKLAGSIGHHMDGHDLIVDATAGYAGYVELGHRVAHGPGMSEVGPKVVAPSPYLRPALYQARG